MKLFPSGLVPVAQALRSQNPSDFLFAKNGMPKLSPGYATFRKSTVKNFSRRSSQSNCFKALGKRSNEQLLS